MAERKGRPRLAEPQPDLESSLSRVREGTMSISKAARQLGMPRRSIPYCLFYDYFYALDHVVAHAVECPGLDCGLRIAFAVGGSHTEVVPSGCGVPVV